MTATARASRPAQVDPRGPRFGALVTMVVFAVVLITGSGWLLAVQGLVFAAGSFLGIQRNPYGMFFRVVIRPRLGPPGELEAAGPPRFAQGIGLVICVLGVIGFATGLTALGLAAAAAGLAAAVLNGVFGLCLGCELYLLLRRAWPARRGPAAGPGA